MASDVLYDPCPKCGQDVNSFMFNNPPVQELHDYGLWLPLPITSGSYTFEPCGCEVYAYELTGKGDFHVYKSNNENERAGLNQMLIERSKNVAKKS